MVTDKTDGEGRLRNAVKSWRESLVLLSGRNRLLNYRPTRSSTLEFTHATADEIMAMVALNRGVPVVGLLPAVAPAAADAQAGDLEAMALDVIEDFDYGSFAHHLFVNKTQRDVDRGLKTLAGTASREFLDRGLSVLYLAMGALHWRELNGDARVSPLVFLPVELRADGPKRPHRVFPSEEDMVVNPALDIRLREHGVVLPDASAIEALVAEGGMAAVESAIGALNLPKEWRVEPLCVLSAFMFAKEAMFRDLEVNEDRVLASELVQSLAGGTDEARERLVFAPADADEIDTVAPPETVPLILDADSSQRVAIAAASEGRSFVLDGPPGTGKSQTIANMIASLVSDGKRVLFVSEKAVALDVVRDRLAARGLGPLLFELHSHKATRAEVAKALGQALSEKPEIVEAGGVQGTARVKELRESLSAYAAAINERRGPIEWSIHEALGKLATLPAVDALPRSAVRVASLTPSVWDSLIDLSAALARVWTHSKLRERHLWHGINNIDGITYDISAAQRALDDLVDSMNTVAPDRAQLGLDRTDTWRQLASLASHWNNGEQLWRDQQWIAEASDHELSALGVVLSEAAQALQAHDNVAGSFGPSWRSLVGSVTVPNTSEALARYIPGAESRPIAEVSTRGSAIASWLTMTERVSEKARALAAQLGLRKPRHAGDLAACADAARTIIQSPPLRADWLTKSMRAELSGVLDELSAAQRGEREAANATSASFLPSIADVDVAPMVDRWTELPGWRRAMFGPSSADRQVLASHSTLKPRLSGAKLTVALEWQVARARLGTASAAAMSRLGFVPDDDPTWAIARSVLERTEYVIGRYGEPDASVLAAAQQSPYQWQALDRSVQELDQMLEERAEAMSSLGPVFDDDSREIAELVDALRAVLRETEVAVSTSQPFSDGAARSLIESRNLQSSIETAGEQWQSLEANLTELGTSFPDLGTVVTEEWRRSIARRLEWTLRTRELTARFDRTAIFGSLATLAWSESLPAAGARWDSARKKLIDRFDSAAVYKSELDDPDDAAELLGEFAGSIDDARALSDARTYRSGLNEVGLSEVIDALLESDAEGEQVADLLRASAISAWIADSESSDSRLRSRLALDRDSIAAQFRELDSGLVERAAARVLSNAVRRRPTTPSRQTSLILGEAEKKKRHIPVRDLIARSRDVIQAIHPCFMMSPLAVSQYLPPDIEFDVVIFDEASQVPPGDAINCLYRAKAVIAAGDQKQLPPTSFFSVTETSDDEMDAEEDLANDYESLLDLMKSSGGYTSISLRWHYRSRHEHLIAYSNNSFYGDRLVTFPGALDVVPDAGVKFLRADGVYRRSQGQDNPKEAQFVAQRVIHHLDTRAGKSVGVVAMSAAQREAISNALVMARAQRPDLDEKFVESRLDGIFIKSLEEVQGDERDVIIMSVGYGPDESGTVYRNFGPINKKGGERRLNVAITRAKELTEVVASMSAGDIGDLPSAGGRHLRRYLDYAERGPVALEIELGAAGLGTDSPFEDAVISSIRSWGYAVQPQVGVSGFRIDIGVKHPAAPGVFMLGVECDGAMYHSAKAARDRDRLRHNILEGLGWNLHHIWGTDWYRNRGREEEKLQEVLRSLEATPPTGRLGAKTPMRRALVVSVETLEFDVRARPEWMKDYIPLNTRRLRALDWTDSSNARHLVPFIEAVADAEGPVHMDVIKTRLREHSDLERVNKHALRTIERAIALSPVILDGEFVRRPRSSVTEPRVAGGRSIHQVHEQEFRLVVLRTLESQAGPTRQDLVLSVSRAFGWQRTPVDAPARVNAMVERLLEEGAVSEADGILRARS